MKLYAAVQNGVILDIFESEKEATVRVDEEIRKDWLSIIVKKSLRKLLKKNGNVSLHRYSILVIDEVKEIK